MPRKSSFRQSGRPCKRNEFNHQQAAQVAGLPWPNAPYRRLGKAYLEALRAKLRDDPKFAFPSHSDGNKHSPLTLWLKSLFQMLDEAGQGLGLSKIRIEEQVRNLEVQLNEHKTSLEEVVIFDALTPILTAKVWTDQAVRDREVTDREERAFCMTLVQAIRPQTRSIVKAVERFMNNATYQEAIAGFVRDEQRRKAAEKSTESLREFLATERGEASKDYMQILRSLLYGVDLLAQGVVALAPETTVPADRRRNREKQFIKHFNYPLLPGKTVVLPLMYSGKVKLFDDVLWLAVEILKSRRTMKFISHIDEVIATAFPLLFPPSLLFPDAKVPFPTTPSAVQRRYSRITTSRS